nr:MAG TPA: hypothetical protein [Caudoviricetes sp.]
MYPLPDVISFTGCFFKIYPTKTITKGMMKFKAINPYIKPSP